MKAARVFVMLQLSPFVVAAEPGWRSEDLAVLVDRCAGNREHKDLIAAVERQVGEFSGSPREASAHGASPYATLSRPDMDWLLTELGRSVLIHANSLSEGLPPVSRFAKPHRMGPLLDGMLPDRFEKNPAEMLAPLVPHVTPDWLVMAADCGSYHFVHSVHLLRGELNDVLRDYQKQENESGLLLLGGTLGIYPRIAEQVNPEDFSTRTLALLLAGAFNDGNFHGPRAAALALACGRWSVRHPELVEELARITPPMSAAVLCPVSRLLVRGEWDEAARLIRQVPDFYQDTCWGLLHTVQSELDPAGSQAAALARALPSENLVGVLYRMLDINKHDDREIERALPLMRELLTRRDLPGGPPDLVFMPLFRATALRWWLAGEESRAHELLRSGFLLETAGGPDDGLFSVAEIERLAGNEAGLVAEVDRLAEAWGEKRFIHHRQAMRKVSGIPPMTAEECLRTSEWAAQGRIIDSLAGDSETALACFNKLTDKERAIYEPWLVLTGNAAGRRAFSKSKLLSPTVYLETRPGAAADPKAGRFSALDAMVKVRGLLDSGDARGARHWFERALVRCQLVDPVSGDRETIKVGFKGSRGSSYLGTMTSSFRVDPKDAMTLAIVIWNLDEPFLRNHVLLEAKRGAARDHAQPGWLPLSRYLARHGAYGEARAAAIAYQVPVMDQKPGGPALLAEIDGLAKSAEGNAAAALLRLNACMTLTPEDVEPGRAILACLAKHCGPEAVATAKDAIRAYWEHLQTEQPGSSDVREAAGRWLALLETS